MPNPGSEQPLRKVTLNLNELDCRAMEAIFGRGWTGVVRDWVNQHVRESSQYHKLRKTLGDLE